MPTCLICHRHEANEVGSHIISRFILESMYNDGAKGSNKEQNFQLSGEGSIAYFGREVLPETIEQTLGRPVTDEDIDGIPNIYVRDHIFCKACEKKLAYLESLYNKKVAVALASGKTLTEQQMRVAHFFWLIIIYRWAITRFGNLQLARPTLVQLATITDAIVVSATSEAEIESNCLNYPITHNVFIGYFPLGKDSGRHQVLSHPEKDNPYILFVNQYILAFNYQRLDQLEPLTVELGVPLGVTAGGTCIKVFPAAEREVLLIYFWQLAAHYLVMEFRHNFIERYTAQHQRPPHPGLTEAFIAEYTQADLLETVKYSTQRQEELMQKYINLTQ